LLKSSCVMGAGGAAAAPSAAAPPAPITHDDFNNDGYRDLVVSAPGGTVSGKKGAGYVAVLYGSASGLTTEGVRVVSQSPRAVPGVPEQGDRFGGAVRLIDADRDKRASLVVGAPGENGGNGGAWVLPATSGGLSFNRSWSFDGGTLRAPVPGARFGETLAPHGR